MVTNLKRKRIVQLIVGIILLNFMPKFLSGCLISRPTKILKKKYHISIRIENLRLRGIKKLTFNSVYIKTDKYGIILKNGVITIKLKSFFRKSSFQKTVEIFDLQEVFFVATSSKANDGVQHNPEENNQFFFEKVYYSIFRKSIEKFWRLSFTGNIKRIAIICSFRNEKVSLFFQDINMAKNTLKGCAEIGIKDYWVKTPFKLYKNYNECEIEISSENLGLATVGVENNHLFSFSRFKLAYKDTDSSNYIISAVIRNILVSSENISSAPVLIKKLESELLIQFTENEFRILKESSLDFDGISSFFEFHHCCSESDLVRFSIILFFVGEDFLQRFPFLSMQNIRRLRARGGIALKLDYMTSLGDFSSFYFNSQILQNTLEIERGKEFDLSYLSGDFIHQIDNSSGTAREINISKISSNFLSLNEIPPFVVNVIVANEDPNFYKHKGIDGHFVGIAIAMNMVNKKYIKGASTITMQLAKNLFLTQKKSVARKSEEAVLAWLMENHFMISKDRILEIYLNIIEFGENIYGLSEASQYYFEKKVSELDITESLVISYIVPRPKYFLEAVLMKSPRLVQRLINHLDFYSNYLLNRKLIDKELYNEIKYDIKFKPSIGTLVLK